jgi:hypothetical protein
VEGAHGGDEADGAVGEELFAAPLSEGGDVAEDFDGCVWDCGLGCSSVAYICSCEWTREGYDIAV